MSDGHAQAKTSGITLKDKIGYALGDTAGIFTFGLVGSFLQMFYTDKTEREDTRGIAENFFLLCL